MYEEHSDASRSDGLLGFFLCINSVTKMAPSKVLIVLLITFCALPVILSSRVLLDNEAHFHKLGSDLSHENVVVDVGSSFREAPAGPDPKHHSNNPPAPIGPRVQIHSLEQ